MLMNRTCILCVLLLFINETGNARVKSACKIYSPDKHTSFEAGADAAQKMVYRIMFNGHEVITWSALGFVLDGIAAGEKVVIKSIRQKDNREKFAWRLGEDDTITNNYNQVILTCSSAGLPFNVIARVFNGSVAFRYEILHQPIPFTNTTRSLYSRRLQ